MCLDCLNDAILKNDEIALLNALTSNFLALKNVNANNIDFYMKTLQEALELKKV